MNVIRLKPSIPQLSALYTFKAPPASVVARLLRPKGRHVFVAYTYQRWYQVCDTKNLDHVDIFVPDGEIVHRDALQQHGPPHICSAGSSDSPVLDAYLRTLMNQAPFGAEFISIGRPQKQSFSYDIRDPHSDEKAHWYRYQIFFWSRKSTHAVDNVV